MEIVRCENGHLFDGEKYKFCPHCGVSNLKKNHVKSN